MNKECFSCDNWNGYACKITGCNKFLQNTIIVDHFSAGQMIAFPLTISGKKFDSWKDIVDYVCIHEDPRYGIG